MTSYIVQILLAALVPATGLTTYLLNRKHKNSVEARDSTAAAMTAVTESAHQVVDLMTEVLDPVQRRLDDQQRQINEQRSKTRKLDTLVHTLLGYTRLLRTQLINEGLEPHPFPEELKAFENEPYKGIDHD